MEIQKVREFFEEWVSKNVENFIDAVFDGKYYVMRENSRLNQKDKEFLILSLNRGWSAWQAATAQAAPEGFVLVSMDRLANAVDGIEALFKEDSALALGELLPIQQDLKAMIEAQEQN